MLTTKINLSYYHYFLLPSHNARKVQLIAFASNKDSPQNSSGKSKPFFQLNFASKFAAQLATGVFALGFIDAGYSGDWSRIGAISKESEEVLKISAFFVVPLCLLVILSISSKQND
ncbi:hypothetical protein Leryth_020921 [Lithospermum erythrorhizon]|uniref:DUF7887 domain-containing protein n=1 Tax=Lithospermum erythrorhizon TaxID=34254 RepID=A0AAV3PW66_LITER|nr:hypothetical protein Leryth_020921 [Lithospermum erythrorhizon]